MPFPPPERQQILRGVQSIAVKAAHRRTRALEGDALHLPPTPSPLDPQKQKSTLSLLSEAAAPPPGGPPGAAARRGRLPSPELRHATSDDTLSSSTGEGPPAPQGTWTRQRFRAPAAKNPTPREADFEARRRKRRSRSFEVTGQAVSHSAVCSGSEWEAETDRGERAGECRLNVLTDPANASSIGR